MKWIIDEKHDGLLIREYLTEVRAFSRRMLKAIKDEGAITLNGQAVNVRERLTSSDELEITFPAEIKGDMLSPKPIPIDIVYEDDDVLVINKQAGLPVIPSRHSQDHSIAHGLLYYYEQKDLPYTVHIVTRLDRLTSGLMLVAKHRFSHSLLSSLQQESRVKRTYTAFVEGELEQERGTIDAPISRKSSSIIEREVNSNGKRAVTHYEVIRQFKNFSQVEVSLETGRTHQIRVHFTYLGHPLLGDDLYGGTLELINRQALHCHRLAFYHPFKQECLHFEIDLPADMRDLFMHE